MPECSTDIAMDYEERAITVATEAGRILLQNGAEIFRVEETMKRITTCYGLNSPDVYVLTNAIFFNGKTINGERRFRLFNIPFRAARLDRVIAVNQLSREIEQGICDMDSALIRLGEIEQLPAYRNLTQVLACGVGCGCFSVMFGGTLMDGLVALIAGLVMQLFVLYPGKHLSKIVSAIFCSGVGTAVCLALHAAGIGHSLSLMIIGAMMTLIPGVEFTNGIRDIADGDYLSGTVRLLDALLTFAGIAIGMAALLMLSHVFLGGALL